MTGITAWIKTAAVIALHAVVEPDLTDLFTDVNLLAIHTGSCELQQKDMCFCCSE